MAVIKKVKANGIAASLSEGQFQPKIVKPKKGKSSYSRKGGKNISTNFIFRRF